ncbi:MAG: adenosylmethionine--8-amino-7-oxononanoate transaminase [Candidatus Omnitrophica bacterium]|nr:adenosylmethionine--8-amino-7-oxononanoate transaminase [Candidatus Omnitrophota bacterium]
MVSEWISRDAARCWHPFTQMKDYELQPPLLITRARGAKLFSADGNYYYDTISSWWCNTLGHNHPRLKAALRRQMNQLEHTLFAGITHPPAIELAERLTAIAPEGLKKVFFSDNGSTAVEVALKMSLQYWRNTAQPQRSLFIGLDHGYHGDTVGAMSVSGRSAFNEVFSPLLFDARHVPAPYCYRCPCGKQYPSCGIACLEPLRQICAAEGNRVSALIIEPLLLAAGGMIVYPREYLEGAVAIARGCGAHIIFDEIATGFCRTGTMFACEQTAATPDFLCLSKGITAGYLPLGVTLVTEQIYQAFYDDYTRKKTFYHGHTYTANPLACAVAVEALKIYTEERVVERVQSQAVVLQKAMQQFRHLPNVGDVRGIGMVGAVELVRDRATKEPFAFEQRVGFQVYREGLAEHLLLRPLGNVIYFFLPFCLRDAEILRIVRRTHAVLAHLK